MNYYFFNHDSSFAQFLLLCEKLGLVNAENTESFKGTAKHEQFIFFLHAVNDDIDIKTKEAWTDLLVLYPSAYTIFVSSQLPIPLGDSLNLSNCTRITKPVAFILKRLNDNTELVKQFKSSCESETGPDMKILEGSGRIEKTLARYLLEIADCASNETLTENHLTDNDIKKELKDSGGECEEYGERSIVRETLKTILIERYESERTNDQKKNS